MCEECRTGICAIFDDLVRDYSRGLPERIPGEHLSEIIESHQRNRPKYVPVDLEDSAESSASVEGFSKMADAADGIGLTRMGFLAELSKRTGLGSTVMSWAQGKVPNGLMRKIILTASEELLRERGARPELSIATLAA